ncbi:MAG: hypothetical protein AAGU73_02150 [Actinomycetota bacterium]
MSVLRLRCVRVLDERVDLVLAFDAEDAPDVARRGAAAERLLEWLPGLARHRCSTEVDRPFTQEMRDTEMPHLFEHVVLEVMACAGSPRTVAGHTVWRRGEDVFRVSIFDDDDAVCAGAARLALSLIEHALGDGAPVDVHARIADVAALRAKPNRQPGAIDPR